MKWTWSKYQLKKSRYLFVENAALYNNNNNNNNNIIIIIIIIDFSLQKHNSQIVSPMKTRTYIVPEGHNVKVMSEEIELNLGISKI
jgi:hypothetical protein